MDESRRMFPKGRPVLMWTTVEDVAHARRTGERLAICGAYPNISFNQLETMGPIKPPCKGCEAVLLQDMPKAG